MYRVESKSCVISRPFSQAESEESSTFGELTAVHETWTDITILVEFQGQTVIIQTTKLLCAFGYRQPKLEKLALDLTTIPWILLLLSFW